MRAIDGCIFSCSAVDHGLHTTLGLGRLAAGIAGDRIGAVNTIVPSTILAAAMTFAWPFAGRTLVGTIVLAVAYGYVSLNMPVLDIADRLTRVLVRGIKQLLFGYIRGASCRTRCTHGRSPRRWSTHGNAEHDPSAWCTRWYVFLPSLFSPLELTNVEGPPTCGAIATATGSYVNLSAFAGEFAFRLVHCAPRDQAN